MKKKNKEEMLKALELFKQLVDKIKNEGSITYENDEFRIYKNQNKRIELTEYKNWEYVSIESDTIDMSITFNNFGAAKGNITDLQNALDGKFKCLVCEMGKPLDDGNGHLRFENNELLYDDDGWERKVKIKYCPECGRKL